MNCGEVVVERVRNHRDCGLTLEKKGGGILGHEIRLRFAVANSPVCGNLDVAPAKGVIRDLREFDFGFALGFSVHPLLFDELVQSILLLLLYGFLLNSLGFDELFYQDSRGQFAELSLGGYLVEGQ